MDESAGTDDRALKILVVDGHPIMASAFRAIFSQRHNLEITCATSAEAAQKEFCAGPPGVSIIDVNVPGLSGFELAKQFLALDAKANILILGMSNDPIYAARALECGAKGYVCKGDETEQIVKAVDAVASGKSFLSAEMASGVAFHYVKASSTQPLLTPRETEILRLLTQGQTGSEIAEALGFSYRTISNSLATIKSKLRARTLTKLVSTTLQQGLLADLQ